MMNTISVNDTLLFFMIVITCATLSLSMVMPFMLRDEREARVKLKEAQDKLNQRGPIEACDDVRFSLHRVDPDIGSVHDCELVAVVADDKDGEYEVQFVALMTRGEVEDLHGQLGRFLKVRKNNA